MKIKQRFPKIDAHGFLERAFVWLDSGIDIGIFYAALELRFTFEKILIRHGFASSNFSKSFEKMNWQPQKLQEFLEKEFSSQINLGKAYKFFGGIKNETAPFGYYFPV